MDILLDNSLWMIYNLFLAVLPVIFSWFLFKMPHKIYTVIVAFLWFLYLPNTIYVFTDLHHLVQQWGEFSLFGKALLVVQYSLLEFIGLTCFLVAFYPIEKILHNYKFSEIQIERIIILINFFIGLALVIGKIERVNSWDVFLNPMFVINSTLQTLVSYQLVALVILFGLFANFFYFLFREQARKLYVKWSR